MKKLNGWVLTIAMMACLTGCFNNEKPNNDVNVPNDPDNSYVENNQNRDEIENIDASGDVENEEATFSMGAWQGNVYINEFLGIRYELQDGWVRGEDKEIFSIMNLTEDTKFESEELRNIAKDFRTVYYFTADNYDSGCGLSVATEKRSADMTVEEYIEEQKNILKNIESEKYEDITVSKATIVDEEYATLYMKIEKYGIHQKYYIKKLEDRFVIIFVSGFDVNDLENSIKAFKNA